MYQQLSKNTEADISSGGGEIISDDTSWQPERVVILEFPDLAQMKAFRDSDEYKPVEELRHKAADTEGFVVAGLGS